MSDWERWEDAVGYAVGIGKRLRAWSALPIDDAKQACRIACWESQQRGALTKAYLRVRVRGAIVDQIRENDALPRGNVYNSSLVHECFAESVQAPELDTAPIDVRSLTSNLSSVERRIVGWRNLEVPNEVIADSLGINACYASLLFTLAKSRMRVSCGLPMRECDERNLPDQMPALEKLCDRL